MLHVDEVDFQKHMLLYISVGQQPTGGYEVEIQRVTVDENRHTITVHWNLSEPDGIVIQVITHPTAVALVEKAAGEVRWLSARPERRRKGRLSPSDL